MTNAYYQTVTIRDSSYEIFIMMTLLRRNIDNDTDHIHIQNLKMARSGHPIVLQKNTRKFLIIAIAL